MEVKGCFRSCVNILTVVVERVCTELFQQLWNVSLRAEIELKSLCLIKSAYIRMQVLYSIILSFVQRQLNLPLRISRKRLSFRAIQLSSSTSSSYLWLFIFSNVKRKEVAFFSSTYVQHRKHLCNTQHMFHKYKEIVISVYQRHFVSYKVQLQ